MTTHIIALEGGATHTRAGLYDAAGSLVREHEGGPANPTAYGIRTCVHTVCTIIRDLLDTVPAEEVNGFAAFAGAADSGIQQELAAAIGTQAGLHSMTVTTDLHALLHANAGAGTGMLVISGTGAAVLARNRKGKFLRTGGWGTLLGDEGSGYAIAAAALRACARAEDGVAMETVLTTLLPETAGLACFTDFIHWSSRASKREIAALTCTIAAAAEAGDIVARSCIEEEARRLAALAVAAQERHHLGEGARLFEYGAVLEDCALFRDAFRAATGYYGDLQHLPCSLRGYRAVYEISALTETPEWAQRWCNQDENTTPVLPVTEQASAVHLDTLSPRDLVAVMNNADKEAVTAVGNVLDEIARAVETAAECVLAGGRIIYAGAGTSGRLGALDAAECPPTFGVSRDRVIALLAGGDRALRESVEGAEDNRDQGARDLEAVQVAPNDFVVGITASGGTPYVQGVLDKARSAGAKTALVTSNPEAPAIVDILIAVDTGPEALTGSTRLKAGTAAKLVLNMISTGAMAKAGYVYHGRMVNMTPVNGKLRQRAQRIVAEIAECTEEDAFRLLSSCGYHISEAILMAKRGMSAEEAAECLKQHQGLLRKALE